MKRYVSLAGELMTMRRDRSLFRLVIAATLALAWPALLNGQPFLFSDTSTYIRGVDAAMVKLTGRATRWTSDDTLKHAAAAPLLGAPKAAPQGNPGGRRATEPVIAGRSIFYGALLYIADLWTSLWLLVIVQAALTAAGVLLTLRLLQDERPSARSDLAIVAVISLVTPIGFFASFAMPDIFGGLAVLAVAAIIVFFDAMPRPLDISGLRAWSLRCCSTMRTSCSLPQPGWSSS